MLCHEMISRRQFGVAVGSLLATASGSKVIAEQINPIFTPASRRLKAVKWGMIELDGDPVERFQLCRDLGFDGMELISPGGPPIESLRAASATTGMLVHGLVNERHWKVRLSSPDDETRQLGREILLQAIRDCASMGGHSVLLVPGVVNTEATHDEVWLRSIAEIRRVLPVCARLGVRILIENVWNGFCEKPEEFRDYLDEVGSPWVGAYFDVGNCQKFSPAEQWIRVLGSRIVKLDIKDWGVDVGFCKIGDGDVNWPAVRKALHEIGFSGWCTAEVAGGGRERLAEIARRMNAVLEG